MFWKVRAVLSDRPGALAALATACAQAEVNILGLQIFPTSGERVLDELVLRTPDGWDDGDVAALCRRAGAEPLDAVACTAKALEDQPVRYLRAAARLLEEPDRLEEQLGLLFSAAPASGAGTTLLARVTDTEQAREVCLRRLAAIAERLRAPATLELRPGHPDDAGGVVLLHERCGRPVTTEETMDLLVGSLVLVRGDAVLALGTLSPGVRGLEARVLVEPAERRRGHGTRLLRALALEVADRGAGSFSMVADAADRAPLATIAAAGLRARARAEGSSVHYEVPVRPTGPSPARDLARMGEVTVPLVALLARRPELREAHPTAGIIDAALRDGA